MKKMKILKTGVALIVCSFFLSLHAEEAQSTEKKNFLGPIDFGISFFPYTKFFKNKVNVGDAGTVWEDKKAITYPLGFELSFGWEKGKMRGESTLRLQRSPSGTHTLVPNEGEEFDGVWPKSKMFSSISLNYLYSLLEKDAWRFYLGAGIGYNISVGDFAAPKGFTITDQFIPRWHMKLIGDVVHKSHEKSSIFFRFEFARFIKKLSTTYSYDTTLAKGVSTKVEQASVGRKVSIGFGLRF